MPMIRINHTTEKNKKEIWTWIEEHIENQLRYKVPREEFKIAESAGDCSFNLKGKNVAARIHVEDRNVDIELDLPLLFMPFKATIEASVRDSLKEL